MVVVPGRSVGMGEHQPDAGRGPNLLLIDRQPLFLAALGSLLTAPPVRASVQVAHDTEAGLEIALRGDVQLVFCEIRSEPIPAVLSGHRAVGSNLMSMVLARLSDTMPNSRRAASQLSPTELDILTMIGQAKSIPVIAAARGISHKTVRNHLANIYRKLELRSRTEAMLCAARMGLTAN